MNSKGSMMRGHRNVFTIFLMILTLIAAQQAILTSAAENGQAFDRVWSRLDLPVLEGEVNRTWFWGPEERRLTMRETYQEAPNGVRDVLYYDKARMEITEPDADPDSIWYVTNGLLVVELVSGEMQVGNDGFEERSPAAVNVAGDATDPDGPTYASFGTLLDLPAANLGDAVIERIDRDGNVTADEGLAGGGVIIAYVDEVTNHAIAEPFWSFMNASGTVYVDGAYVEDALFENAFFATGRPIAEPYWATVRVGGTAQDVLMQCFERRCLTYTPENDPGWQVEAGNVGAHYFEWRYGDLDAQYSYAGQIGQPRVPSDPEGIAIAADGTIIVADGERNLILHYDDQGNLLDSWSEEDLTGQDLNGFSPHGLDVDADGNLYVADWSYHRIVKLSPSGEVLMVLGGERGAEIGQFEFPADVALDATGNIYVADSWNARIQVFDASGSPTFQIGAGEGDEPGQFDNPRGVHIGPDGSIYVADTNNDRVQKFDGDGQFQTLYASQGPTSPHGISTSQDGRVFVARSFSSSVVELDSDLNLQGFISYSWDAPSYLTFDDESGTLYVSDADNHRIVAIGSDGDVALTWPEASAGWQNPVAVTHDATGATYVADEEARVVRKFDPSGNQVEGWTIPLPYDVNFGLTVKDLQVGLDGQIYILLLDEVLVASADGTITNQFAVRDEAPADIGWASALQVDDAGQIYVGYSGYVRTSKPASETSSGVSRFSADGQFDVHWNFGVPDRFEISYGLGLILEDDRFYVDQGYGIVAYDLEGNPLDSWLSGAVDAIAGDSDGNIYVARNSLANIGVGELPAFAKYDPQGVLLAEWEPIETIGCNGNFHLDIAVSPSGEVSAITDDDCVVSYAPAG